MSKKNQNTPEPLEAEEEKTTESCTEDTCTEGTSQEPVQAPETDATQQLQAELQAEKEKYLRLLAEYDNFRKRSAKERESLYAEIRSDTIIKFLPVYDNLVRALAQSTIDEAYSKGVVMIMNQMKATLEKLGVSEIEALGQTFNPELHNAVMHVDDESFGKGEIIEEFEKGFKLGDKVIRFSMVKVAN